MLSHAPDNFISVPVPCDLKPLKTRKLEGGLREDSTYSRQAYQPIAQIAGKEQDWEPPRRAFHRLSLVFTEADIETSEYSRIIPLCLKIYRSHITYPISYHSSIPNVEATFANAIRHFAMATHGRS